MLSFTHIRHAYIVSAPRISQSSIRTFHCRGSQLRCQGRRTLRHPRFNKPVEPAIRAVAVHQTSGNHHPPPLPPASLPLLLDDIAAPCAMHQDFRNSRCNHVGLQLPLHRADGTPDGSKQAKWLSELPAHMHSWQPGSDAQTQTDTHDAIALATLTEARPRGCPSAASSLGTAGAVPMR